MSALENVWVKKFASPSHLGRVRCGQSCEPRPVLAPQVVGAHQRAGDLKVNVCKKKAVTNMRASGTDNKTPLTEAMRFSLDEALEYIVDDEMVEVTPQSVRIRKAPAAARRAGKK